MRTTELNYIARNHIANISEANDWRWCFLKFERCWNEASEPAHRHERNWYKGKAPELLWAVEQWVPACRHCHHILDHEMSKAAREELFIKLRGGV
jgi:hypothetical protein